ncbi:EAL domain-containing protein [Maridesulfovibrio zosterae]|uniref:EAL domain-containing protein n=1 Tax=Maridesulfovibrio zosterae TaxID=82171 RepID=UPI0003F9D664|nr:EAL domain-containing protein [Maridesulfovibrio zosterae]
MSEYNFSRRMLKINSAIGKVGELVFFKALQRSMLLAFPLIIIGSMSLCVLNIPINILQEFISPEIREFLSNVVSGTYGISSLVVLCCMSYNMGSMYNSSSSEGNASPCLYVVIALSGFFILHGDGSFSSFTQVISLTNGMFQAICIAGITGFIFHKLLLYNFRIPVFGAGYDLFSMEIFSLLPASVLAILTFPLIRFGMEVLGFDSFNDLLYRIVLSVVNVPGDDFSTGFMYVFISQILWFFGAHGPNVLYAVDTNVFAPNVVENVCNLSLAVPPAHILTKGFIDAYSVIGGSGFTTSLLIAILFKSRDAGTRRISQLALLACLFNINEPLLFGIPLIFNPVYALPFIFVPVIMYCISYAATFFHIIPYTTGSFHWTTPFLLSGYYASGGMSGVFMQVFNIALGVGLYMPFVHLSDHILKNQYVRGMQVILKEARRNKTSRGSKRFNLTGFEGFVVRSLANDFIRDLKYEQHLYIVYQPQVNTIAGKSSGAEALLRWNHPVFGHIPPEITVALAEDVGRIEDLSVFVLREACQQFCAWKTQVDADYVSVNFSPSLLSGKMTERVMKTVRESGMPLNCLEIEITESVAISSGMKAIEVLKNLREAGIRISIDDFGMGHTSLRYLREMPIDKVKIDRSLTLGSANGLNKQIVSSIIDLCRNINVSVIIEGVENIEQMKNFQKMGGFSFQGYYFSKPVSGEDCLAFMQNWTCSCEVCFIEL